MSLHSSNNIVKPMSCFSHNKVMVKLFILRPQHKTKPDFAASILAVITLIGSETP